MVRAKWRETGEQKAASTNRVVREILSVEMPIKLKPEKRRGLKRFSGDTCTHLCTHMQTTGTHANHRHTYTHKYTCTHAEMHTYICNTVIHSHVSTLIHTHADMHIYIRIHTPFRSREYFRAE